jgi:hypothetical protein
MGGVACQVERNAMLQYESVPTDPKELPDFDKQLRACFTLDEIAVAVETNGTGMDVCALLWKFKGWTHADRVELLGYLNGIWGPATGAS